MARQIGACEYAQHRKLPPELPQQHPRSVADSQMLTLARARNMLNTVFSYLGARIRCDSTHSGFLHQGAAFIMKKEQQFTILACLRNTQETIVRRCSIALESPSA